jgi:hypothetical protein
VTDTDAAASASPGPEHANAPELLSTHTPVRRWSPPLLPANTPLKKRVDDLMPTRGLPCLLYLAGVIAALSVAPHLPTRLGLGTDGLAAMAAGSWCALNFWRCRQAHCLISGTGWLALSLIALTGAVIGRSLIAGRESAAFLAILIVAVIFEYAWSYTHGSNALTSATPDQQRKRP